MSYGIIEPEAFTSMMALLQITSAEEAEGKFEDTPLQTAFEVEVLSYEDQDEDDGARVGHKFQDWASFKKDTRTGGIGIAYGGKLWNLIAATLGEASVAVSFPRSISWASASVRRLSAPARISTASTVVSSGTTSGRHPSPKEGLRCPTRSRTMTSLRLPTSRTSQAKT